MIDSFRNIFAIPDLRKRIMFTFALLAVYRVGCVIPTPGVDPQALIEVMNAARQTMLGFLNTFTGGSIERAAIFAIGIMPYITASIILQLLTVVVPYLEKLSKEGELGRARSPSTPATAPWSWPSSSRRRWPSWWRTSPRRAACRWCPIRAGASASPPS